MDREQARILLKARLGDYLQGKGIDTRKGFRCLNPSHADHHPSMRYDGRRNKAHCFACGADYDLFDLIALDYGLTDHREIFSRAYALYHIEPDRVQGHRGGRAVGETEVFVPSPRAGNAQSDIGDRERGHTAMPVSAYLDAAFGRISGTGYPQSRGLTEDTIRRFRIGYDPRFRARMDDGAWRIWDAIILPTGPESFVARNTDTRAQRRDRIRKTGGNPLFNAEALKNDRGEPVFIVEGEIDAMSVVEVGGECVGLGSTSNVRRLIAHLREDPPRVPLLLALDADERGRCAQRELCAELEALHLPFYEVDILRGSKDPNEALVADRDGFMRAVAAAKAVRGGPESREGRSGAALDSCAARYLGPYISGEDTGIDAHCRKTGFVKLDRQLDGGLFAGLYILGAITSLGKTTFVLQMADQIAQAGTDVMIVSLEMGRGELIAKSVSRHMLLQRRARGQDVKGVPSAREIMNGDWRTSEAERAGVREAAMAYGRYAEHVHIREGIGAVGTARVREWLDVHVGATGSAPVVVIDYLQILAGNERHSDKQNIDRAVLELKRIARDYRTPVVAVSSLNRQSYRGDVTLEAFKESGAIEYGSDVLLGMQFANAARADFDVMAERRRDPRRVEVRVLKNRNGISGGSAAFEYYPAASYFQER